MSDVGNAPPPAPTPAPAAPAANEAVINQNPVAAPAPVGSQAPPKPPETPVSRRDAIQRAFNRSRDPNEPKPGPAKPAIGHNQPPEDTKVERAKPKDRGGEQGQGEGGLDLRRPPTDQPRDRGKFAPRQQQDPARAPGQQAQPGQPGQQARGPAPQLPEGAPYRDPPQRMKDHAKAEWAHAPESVRGEVHRMHQEFSNAYARYKGDHDVMNTIRPFHEMATSHGTTLDKALNNYVSMEQMLRTDVVRGLDVIVNNLNLRAPDGSKLGLRDISYHVLSQTPDQHKALQTQNQTSAIAQQLGQLHQQQQVVAQELQQLQYERQFSYTRSEVDRFADSHPRFDEISHLIKQELDFGFDLETAYRRAEMLAPDPAPQTRTPTAQTRPTDRSISGAPDATGPSNGTSSKKPAKQVSRRDAIENAMKRVNGSL